MPQLPADAPSYRTFALCLAALILTLFLAGGQLKGSSHSVHLQKGSSAAPAPEAAWAGAQRREGLEGFISATSTTSERHGLAKTNRAWRKVGRPPHFKEDELSRERSASSAPAAVCRV